MMTSEQAMTGLVTIVGSGGLSALGVAFFGYLAAARQGRPKAEMPTISFGGPEGPSAELAATSLGSIASHLARLTAIVELDAEQRFKGRDFRSQVDGREMLILREDIARGQDKD